MRLTNLTPCQMLLRAGPRAQRATQDLRQTMTFRAVFLEQEHTPLQWQQLRRVLVVGAGVSRLAGHLVLAGCQQKKEEGEEEEVVVVVAGELRVQGRSRNAHFVLG
jgi:hypothetical protein